MKYISIPSYSRRWLSDKTLNSDRIERYYVRAKTKKRCIELLQKYGPKSVTAHYVNQFGLLWGNRVEYPEGEEEGVWITRDISDKKLVKISE